MGLFTSKQKIASATVHYSNDKKMYIVVQIFDLEKINELHLSDDKKVAALIFMFYFDKNLFNLNEVISNTTLSAFHQTITEHLNAFNDDAWITVSKELTGPNKWIYLEKNDELENEIVMDLYIKGSRIFIKTHFPLNFTEPMAYLIIEAFYFYLLKDSSVDFANWFLPKFLLQCATYNGQRPSLSQLGQSPLIALNEHADFIKQLDASGNKLYDDFIKKLDD